mgnify:CR=1 FL=1
MKPNKLELSSVDGTKLNLEALYQIAPSCFTEVKDEKTGELRHVVNFTTLRQLLGDDAVEDAEEMYQFTWPGKQEARREAARPTTKTLRPVVEDSVDWDHTQNLYIEGDNLEVLKLLQKSYMGKVKMIYIDPPYNTGNDFVYDDDFAASQDDYDLFAGNVDELGNRYRKNTETNGRFHSDWCSMMYSRLLVARSFLTEDGAIFISIDDNEIDNIKKICDEVFGRANYGGTIIWKKKTNGNNVGVIPPVHDYILVYTKNINSVYDIGFKNNDIGSYSNPDNDPRGLWKTMDLSANHKGPYFGITNPNTGEVHFPSDGRYWVFNEQEVLKRIKDGRIIFGKSGNAKPVQRVFLSERGVSKRKAESWWDKHGMNEDATAELTDLFGIAKVFSHPKPVELIYNLCSIILDEKDILLDFFSGSATSAHAILKLNSIDEGKRHFILVQLSENIEETLKVADTTSKAYAENSIKFLDGINKPHYITEIAKERIRRAGKKIKEESPLTTQNLDTGFRVFRLADSNFEEVKKAPAEYDQSQLDLFLDNVKGDRTDLDLLFGAMLSWGVQLSLPMISEEVDGKMIYTVNEGDLVACFAENITENIVKAMAEKQPLRVLFRDSCFARDDAKINVFEIFKQLLDWSEEEAMKNIKVI